MNANKQDAGGLPATGPFVDRLIRIFRDKPHDDASALVLIEYAELCRAAPAGSGEVDLMVRQLDERAKWFREENGQDATLLRQCAALLRALSRGVPEGMVLVQRMDAERLARFGMNNAGDGLRSDVKLSAMRVAAIAAQRKEG